MKRPYKKLKRWFSPERMEEIKKERQRATDCMHDPKYDPVGLKGWNCCDPHNSPYRTLGDTSVHKAVYDNDIEYLEKQIAYYRADINTTNTKGQTPLHLAVLEGNIPAAKILMKHHADHCIRDNKGKTPRDLIIELGLTQSKLK